MIHYHDYDPAYESPPPCPCDSCIKDRCNYDECQDYTDWCDSFD